MIRRQFIRRTLGVIAGAVCAPFVGKAATVSHTHKMQHGGMTYIYRPERGYYVLTGECACEHRLHWMTRLDIEDRFNKMMGITYPEAADPGAT
jgi:hypothetical protein